MPTQQEQISQFWNWFTSNRAKMDALVVPEDAFWDVALSKLHEVHEGLYFEMSEPDGGVREFVVTAWGDDSLFPLVDVLVGSAPAVDRWRFVALKPSMGFTFKTRYEDLELDPAGMWFLPLVLAKRPDELAIRVGIPDLAEGDRKRATTAVLMMLDTGLGERAAARDIGYLDVIGLPPDPAAEGYIELPELAAYITWHARKIAKA